MNDTRFLFLFPFLLPFLLFSFVLFRDRPASWIGFGFGVCRVIPRDARLVPFVQ